MQNWIWKQTNGIDYITLPTWEDMGVTVAFSGRNGGTSEVPYQSLNLGLHVGDKTENVIHNRNRFLSALGQKLDSVTCCQQVHGTRVAVVNKKDAGKGAYDYATSLADYDAMVSNIPGIMLTTFYADCIPLFFFDPVHKVVALAHSGWKGTMGKIACKTVETMQQQYGSLYSEIYAFIGPGIDSCCFNIQEDLAKKVTKEFAGLSDIINMGKNGYRWDLKETNYQILIQIGFRPENITCCDLCTSCCLDKFYSYRREKGLTGRMGAVIGLKY